MEEDIQARQLTITVEDNGRGMEPEFLVKRSILSSPRGLPARSGLGLIIAATVRRDWRKAINKLIQPRKWNQGDGIHEVMAISIASQWATCRNHGDPDPGNPDVDFVYVHRKNGKEYHLDTRELRAET